MDGCDVYHVAATNLCHYDRITYEMIARSSQHSLNNTLKKPRPLNPQSYPHRHRPRHWHQMNQQPRIRSPATLGEKEDNNRRGNRGTPQQEKTSVPKAPRFEGRCDKLKGHIYNCSDSQQTDRYTKTTGEIAEYIGRTYQHGADIPWRRHPRSNRAHRSAHDLDTTRRPTYWCFPNHREAMGAQVPRILEERVEIRKKS
jgi:hypothetical protein